MENLKKKIGSVDKEKQKQFNKIFLIIIIVFASIAAITYILEFFYYLRLLGQDTDEVGYAGFSKFALIMFMIYYIFSLVFQVAWVFINFKIFKAVSDSKASEVNDWCKKGLIAYGIFAIVSLIFFIWMKAYGGFITLIINFAIAFIWFWYVK